MKISQLLMFGGICFLFLLVICNPVGATDVNFSAAAINSLQKYSTSGVTWDTLHDAATSNAEVSRFKVAVAADNTASLWYIINRGFVTFNTSSIPDADNVTAAYLYNPNAVITQDNWGDGVMYIVTFTPADPSNPNNYDYDQFGTENTYGYDFSDSAGYLAINPTWVNKTGYTCLGIRDRYDLIDTAPSWKKNGIQELQCSMVPILYVTYGAAPTPTPTPTPTPDTTETYIHWDKDSYIQYESAIIEYSISNSDWDSSAYSYYGRVLSSSNVVLDSWEITTQPDGEIEPVFVDTDTFPAAGTYTCTLVAVKKSTWVEYTVGSPDAAYMDFTSYVTVVGTTVDAINSTALVSTSVTATQSGTSQSTTSGSITGLYSIGGLYTDAWISVNGTKAGWTCTALGYTPLVGGTVNIDLALIPSGGAVPGDWNDDGDGAYTDTTYSNTSTSYWTVADGTSIGGYVYAGPLMAATSGAVVTIANGTWNDTYTTTAGGWYMFTETDDGLSADEYTLTVTKTGYEEISVNATTIEDYFARKDFYLGIGTYTDDSSSGDNTSYWDTGDGTAAGGVVFLGPLWSAAEGATVAIANGTWSNSFTTLSGGWWQYDEADGLGDNETYTMTVSKTGYDTVTANITCLADNFTRKDFYLGEIYALTVHIKDSKTESYITSANVSAILGGATSTTVNTTDGTAEFTGLSYGTYSLSVSADGYYAVSSSVTVESATDTETVYLLAKEDLDIGDSGPSSNYPPHMVRITYMDTMGNPVDGATVTATAVESSTPWDWMAGAFGFDEDYVDIRNETLIGTTDSGGTITFLMVESVRYSVNCVQSADGVDHTFSVFPKESEYFIRIGTLPVVTSYPAYNLTAYDLNATHVRLSMNYTDTANQTADARFIVENISGSEVYNTSVTLTAGSGTAYYDVNNTKGDSYSFRLEANNSQHGTITSMMGIDLKGSGRLVEFGWPALWYYLLSFGCLFMLAGAFGEMDVKIGGILVPLIGAGIFWYIGWLPVNLGSIIFVAVFVGVFYYMRAKLPAVTDG